MLEATRQRLLAAIGPHDLVLDIGGWADPFERADWVLDMMPFETRGLYRREGWVQRIPEPERFSAQTWIHRDVCDHEPYPFEDDELDYVICSHTLEDLRDPLWVCREMNRIAKAGYIEVPSRLEEQSWGVNGAFVGWSHHRWLIDIEDHEIVFVGKPHSVHSHPDQYFPHGFWELLSETERVQSLWWTDRFSYRERVILEEEAFNRYLRDFVAREFPLRAPSGLVDGQLVGTGLGELRRKVLRRLRRHS